MKRDIFHQCEVADNRSLGSGIFLLSLKLKLSTLPQPGSFLHIKPANCSDPLFRRAFSVYDYDSDKQTVDILYKVVGRGTTILSRVRCGETIDVLGPLGNGFELPADEEKLLLVGGGVGIPPLYLLAKSCVKQGISKERILFLCGLSGNHERAMSERVEALPIQFKLATDDGSAGHHGFVTDLLKEELSDSGEKNKLVVCACGPEAMLAKVQRITREHQAKCYLSLESTMPCGVGTCLGCVVKQAGVDRYLRVCHDGPVFNAVEVEL